MYRKNNQQFIVFNKTKWLSLRRNWKSGSEWYDIAPQISNLSEEEVDSDYEISAEFMEKYDELTSVWSKRKMMLLLVILGLVICIFTIMLCLFLYGDLEQQNYIACGLVLVIYVLLAILWYRLFYRWLDFKALLTRCKLECYDYIYAINNHDIQDKIVYADLDDILDIIEEYHEPEAEKKKNDLGLEELLNSFEGCQQEDKKTIDEAFEDSGCTVAYASTEKPDVDYKDINVVINRILEYLS